MPPTLRGSFSELRGSISKNVCNASTYRILSVAHFRAVQMLPVQAVVVSVYIHFSKLHMKTPPKKRSFSWVLGFQSIPCPTRCSKNSRKNISNKYRCIPSQEKNLRWIEVGVAKIEPSEVGETRFSMISLSKWIVHLSSGTKSDTVSIKKSTYIVVFFRSRFLEEYLE